MLLTFPFQLLSLKDFPNVVEVEEVGSTFGDNAILKAKGYAEQTGLLTLADDSGLEVNGLDGAPGVLSARYTGRRATDAQRTSKLLTELSSSDSLDRRARFVCVIAIFDSMAKYVRTFEGICEGRIALTPEGTHGFGYDPVFIPDGFSVSFGCLDATIKQEISHRGRALRAASEFLRELSVSPA